MPEAKGPRRLTNKDKKLRGETRPSRANEAEPQVVAAEPKRPPWVKGRALVEWKVKVKQLAEAGMLTAIDDTALGLYCVAWAKVEKLIPLVESWGHTLVAANGGYVRNPDSVALVQAETALNRAMVELGITPSSRTRVKAAPKPKKDAWSDFE